MFCQRFPRIRRAGVCTTCFMLTAITLLLARTATAAPTLILTERAMEMAVVSYRVNPGGRGTAIVTHCRHCDEPVTLGVTPRTRLFVDGRELRPADLPVVDRRAATLYFDPAGMQLNRIILRGPPPVR